jgi:hypothetical protein
LLEREDISEEERREKREKRSPGALGLSVMSNNSFSEKWIFRPKGSGNGKMFILWAVDPVPKGCV